MTRAGEEPLHRRAMAVNAAAPFGYLAPYVYLMPLRSAASAHRRCAVWAGQSFAITGGRNGQVVDHGHR